MRCTDPCPAPRPPARGRGFTAVELLFACAVLVTAGAIAAPAIGHALDESATASAARYLAGTLRTLRHDAARRSAAAGLVFGPAAAERDPSYRVYRDGNGNGIRTADITAGTDPPVAAAERIGDKFRGVRLQLAAGTPGVDGAMTSSADGVRLGASRILAFSPDGTSSSGTLYVRGRRAQYAVRVMGFTGRTRVLEYQPGSGTWVER